MTKNTHIEFTEQTSDDYSVLNFLLEHVKGLSPSSFSPKLALDEVVDEDVDDVSFAE